MPQLDVAQSVEMAGDQIVLHFEVAEGRHPDTRIIAESLLKWVTLIEEAAKAIDPTDRIELEIVGNDIGSLRFPQILKFIDRGIENVDDAWSTYPYIKRAVLGSAHVLAAGLVGGIIQASLAPPVQKVELSDKDRKTMERWQEQVADSPAARSATRAFYSTVERDSAITGVGVAKDRNSPPDVIIPRSEFQTRSGLWAIEEDVDREQVKHDVWDVVLLRAPFSHKRLQWQFSRDGLPFSAKMNDAIFLAAIKDGRVPINLQEGVMMRVEVEYIEILDGQVWVADPRSRRIVRVLSPTPLPPGTASLSDQPGNR